MLTVPHRLRPDAPHAVIIGSGFGGLAAAIRLGARGYRVTVLERLTRAGGRAGMDARDGFVFDQGPTIVTAPQLFEELWTLAGARMSDDIDMRALDPFYTIRFDDGVELPCSADLDRMRETVRRIAPDDLPGYDRFLVRSREICRIGFEQLGAKPFSSPVDMLKIAPELIRLGGYRSVHGYVSSFVRHPRLRFILSFHPLLIGGNPFRAPAIYCLIPDLERRWGVHYPMGGVNRLVGGMVALIERLGGRVRLGADVAGIETEGKRARAVRLTSGERIACDLVVSNADPAFTYGTLLKGHGGRWGGDRLARARYSMGLFVWYFGTSRRYDDVGHHTIVLGPRYRELLHDIFEKRKPTDDFSIYLHRPSATDPSVAPAGCDAFYALTPVANLDSGVDWRATGEAWRRKVAARLSETVLPGLEAHVVSSRFVTPLDFRDDYLSERGAGFGLEPVLTQSAWFRPNNRSESLDNFYLVGAGTHPGAGLPGVLSSARILDEVVPDVPIHA
jgi:phytoene desaturase